MRYNSPWTQVGWLSLDGVSILMARSLFSVSLHSVPWGCSRPSVVSVPGKSTLSWCWTLADQVRGTQDVVLSDIANSVLYACFCFGGFVSRPSYLTSMADN